MIIGIYGTIGSGKTRISKRFQQLKFQVIECDALAKEIVKKKHFQKKIKKFFPQCFENNELQRHELRRIIFNDENERLKLNSIVWPEIKNQIITKITTFPGNYVIDGALLPELELQVDLYIEVRSSFITAAYRVLKRDKKSKKETLAIYLKQKNALTKFKKLKRIKINNSFWNKKLKVKQIKKIIEKIK